MTKYSDNIEANEVIGEYLTRAAKECPEWPPTLLQIKRLYWNHIKKPAFDTFEEAYKDYMEKHIKYLNKQLEKRKFTRKLLGNIDINWRDNSLTIFSKEHRPLICRNVASIMDTIAAYCAEQCAYYDSDTGKLYTKLDLSK